MDPVTKQISRSCSQAVFGYGAAATAAFTEMACCALDFWSVALSGFAEETTSKTTTNEAQPVARPVSEPAFGMAVEDWSPMSWFDPRRFEALWRMDSTTPPVTAMMTMANAIPLRGTSTSWGMAQVMIDSGVPRSIAWPAAEANAAALEAADAASNGFRKVVASFHSESGYATTARAMTPSLVMASLMVAANAPLSWSGI